MYTQEQLFQEVRYDPDTGNLYWLKNHRRKRAGEVAGTPGGRGYVKTQILGVRRGNHRIAWFYTHGYWPDEIDHVNGDPSDNRLHNLREVTHAQNSKNRKTNHNSTTGIKGIKPHKGKFVASLTCDGETLFLGVYETASAAKSAYDLAAYMYHGEFARS